MDPHRIVCHQHAHSHLPLSQISTSKGDQPLTHLLLLRRKFQIRSWRKCGQLWARGDLPRGLPLLLHPVGDEGAGPGDSLHGFILEFILSPEAWKIH